VVVDTGQGSSRTLDELVQVAHRVGEAVESVIEGKSEAVRLALTVLLAEGHVLIEDVPGVGKTMLAKALARSTGCSVRRIQFTPDLLPSDITGVSAYNQERREFEFKPGPVFANIVVGDEINRASPKTQSALLECMEERQVTVDGRTYSLSPPFMVIATQNPIEMEGTYPLPEAQRDRFTARISMGYPSADGPLCRAAEAVRYQAGRRDPRLPGAAAGCLAAGHAPPAAGGPGQGRPGWPRLRHPRRHAGAGPAGTGAPAAAERRGGGHPAVAGTGAGDDRRTPATAPVALIAAGQAAGKKDSHLASTRARP
jgi:hypothetical protein